MYKIAIIDNYDSFVYNLAYLIRQEGHKVDVFRNDQVEPEALVDYDGLLLSPGPGIPDEAGNLKRIIRYHLSSKPMLGVCLGHQAMGEVMGVKLRQLKDVLHGVVSTIQACADSPLLVGMPVEWEVCHYHSWVLDEHTLTDECQVTSRHHSGLIMSIEHRLYPVYGVQFHPESFGTQLGNRLISNWINCIDSHKKELL